MGQAGVQSLTLRRSSPCEMFSASMKADTRWWMGPASPQCGLSTNVWKPLCLGGQKTELGPKPGAPRLLNPNPVTLWAEDQGSGVGSWLQGLNYRAPGAEKQPVRSKNGVRGGSGGPSRPRGRPGARPAD